MRKLDETNRAEPNKKKKESKQTRLSEKQQRIWHKRQHQKNNEPHWMTFSLHKTPSLTSGWVLALWPPGSRNWTVAVCVLTGREANSSKHLLSFATPTQKPSVESLPDEPTAPVMWDDLQPFRKLSLRRFCPERTAINQKKKTSMLIQNLPLYVLKLPWNGKTVSGVGEGGGVWCVISPRPPPPSPNLPPTHSSQFITLVGLMV